MNKRINYIDIARAFAIIFIVIGHTIVHSEHCGEIFRFLYSFHVVLFFIISGYTFKIKENEDFLSFIKNKFLRIMLPYFIWAVCFLIPYLVLGNNVASDLETNSSFNIKTLLFNILYGNGNASALKQNSALWFLPALFTMEMMCYFLIKIIKSDKKKEIISLIISVVVGYLSVHYLKIVLPWGINSALNLGCFMLLGYTIKDQNLFDTYLNKWYVIVLLFIIGILAFYFNTSGVACIDYSYGIYTYALLSGVSLSIVVIFISKIIKQNKLLEYIGRNTMGILIFHKLVILVFQTKVGVISSLLRNSNFITELAMGLVVSAISILCSLIAATIIRRLLPVLIGEKVK